MIVPFDASFYFIFQGLEKSEQSCVTNNMEYIGLESCTCGDTVCTFFQFCWEDRTCQDTAKPSKCRLNIWGLCFLFLIGIMGALK